MWCVINVKSYCKIILKNGNIVEEDVSYLFLFFLCYDFYYMFVFKDINILILIKLFWIYVFFVNLNDGFNVLLIIWKKYCLMSVMLICYFFNYF